MTQQNLIELEKARQYFLGTIPTLKTFNDLYHQHNTRLSYWIKDRYVLIVYFRNYGFYSATLNDNDTDREIRVHIDHEVIITDAINQFMDEIVKKIENAEWVNEDE